jgi:hypothetical protein
MYTPVPLTNCEENHKLCKTEQKHQKAGWRGQSSNFFVRDLLKINEFLGYYYLYV